MLPCLITCAMQMLDPCLCIIAYTYATMTRERCHCSGINGIFFIGFNCEQCMTRVGRTQHRRIINID